MRLTIGGFDGMHFAHQKLFSLSDEILVIEKDSHLTPFKTRCEYTHLKCHFYDLEKIKHLNDVEFIQKIKQDFNPKEIVVGYDFRFGKNRKGSIDTLKKYFQKVIVVEEIKLDGIGVHSREIKSLIQKADIQKANKLLSHTYKIKATQISGQGIGSKQLLPTINLKPVYDYILPKNGVYITLLNNQPSLTFIGTRSTDNSFSIETHILNNCTTSNFYDIEFIDFLRENKKFNNSDELKQAIITDKEYAIHFFRRKYDIK